MQYSIMYREKGKGIQVIVQYKDINGTWKQKTKQGFKKKKDAKEYADKLIEELKKDSLCSNDYKNIKIVELKTLYLKHILQLKEYNTYTSVKNALKRFSIDHMTLKELSRLNIQTEINTMAGRFSPSTVAHSFEVLKTFLNWIEYTLEVPTLSLKGVSVPKDKKNSKRALDPYEVNKLLEIYSNNKNKSLNNYIAVLLSVKAGLRAGEICGITWEDINFTKRTININKQLKRGKDGLYVIGSLKSANSYRIIPMSNYLHCELLSIKDTFPINSDNRLVSIKTTVSLTVNLDKQLQQLFKISMHELRHTFATDLISHGIDFKTTALILGHDVKETIETYSHVTNTMLNNATEIIKNI